MVLTVSQGVGDVGFQTTIWFTMPSVPAESSPEVGQMSSITFVKMELFLKYFRKACELHEKDVIADI
jgi:hypothetical protein